jgi:dipeptidyl aminopeptidase/acylaminoacyl peptidase
MNGSDLDRRLSSFFDTASSEALPGGLLDDVYAVTRRLPQRRGPAARWTTALAGWWANPFGSAPLLRVLAVAALLVIALIATLTYAAGHLRKLPPPYGPASNGIIVYDVDGRMTAVEADGTTHPLNIGLGRNFNATFSPDGTRFAFWSQAADGPVYSLLVANADGSGAVPVSRDQGNVGRPIDQIAWSPDGTRIAFAAGEADGTARIYVAAADGSGVMPITPADGGRRTSPAWSPQGDLIAYRRTPTVDSPQVELDVATPDGSGERTLVTAVAKNASDIKDGVFAAPQWSPDGSKLAYARLEDGRFRAGIVDRDSGNEELVSEPWEDVNPPVWSNDGTRLAWSRYPSGAAIHDLASGTTITLKPGLAECAISWSPDDRILLGFGRDCGHGLFRIPVDNPDAATPISSDIGLMNGAGWQRIAP